jgi:subtilase family serine protease
MGRRKPQGLPQTNPWLLWSSASFPEFRQSILSEAFRHPNNTMQTPQFCSMKRLLAAALLGSFCALNAGAQATAPRITQAVTDSNLVTLRGNIHPLARPEYDRGVAPAGLPMDHMMLLLKRSPQQEAALEKLLAAQQDRTSPDFHRWLTPAQFGAEFGPADQDIQKIEAWLESHGFSIDRVSTGRTVIEFSGSAGEVQGAFHTEIHRYVMPSGAQHWANSSDPSIPAALAPIVSGIRSLNNFYPRPLSRVVSTTRASQTTARSKPHSLVTFQASGPCSAVQSFENDPSPECFMIAPSDLGAIYNIQPLWSSSVSGTGETIAIANDSNINLTDVSSFRSIMGLAAGTPPKVILANGTDPGLTGDESEAVLDVEWSGATAPGASVELVIAPTSQNGSFGGDIAAEYTIDNNLAPILSYSFGAPEQCSAGGVGNFYGPLWQQAAAEGITVLVASGDNGSAGCDAVPTTPDKPGPATHGLAVNGLASPPNSVAVGGTDFNDVSNPGLYWNTGNSTSTSTASAKGYVPETAWNESCTNAVFSTAPLNAQFGNSQEAACNNSTLEMPGANSTSFVVPSGGSGGVSQTYPQPSWQTGLGPSSSGRELPDISLFAGTGAISASFYYLCESDLSNPPQNCSLSGTIDGVGGTSVSAQVMAGIVALIDQHAGGPQGNINPALYGLASQPGSTCPSAANPNASCIFYDVATGTIAMPCAFGATPSPNCNASSSSVAYGILVDSSKNPAFNAASGYDLATGLGSINVSNLANANVWAAPSGAADFSITSSNATVTLGSNNKGSMQITITPQNGFSGAVNLSCPGLPSADSCSFSPSASPTISGATNITVTVSGTLASVPNTIKGPAGPAGWPLRTELLFAFACFAALLLFGMRVRQRRWSPVLALLTLSLFAIAGCSGGGGGGSPSGNNGGGTTGSPFTTTVTATTCNLPSTPGCSGGITHSLPFTIN